MLVSKTCEATLFIGALKSIKSHPQLENLLDFKRQLSFLSRDIDIINCRVSEGVQDFTLVTKTPAGDLFFIHRWNKGTKSSSITWFLLIIMDQIHHMGVSVAVAGCPLVAAEIHVWLDQTMGLSLTLCLTAFCSSPSGCSLIQTPVFAWSPQRPRVSEKEVTFFKNLPVSDGG